VPHISLVFREIWDTTEFDLKAFKPQPKPNCYDPLRREEALCLLCIGKPQWLQQESVGLKRSDHSRLRYSV
jgi:hypothetical protein